MAHDITDNRNEKLIDHVASVLVFPLSLILSLKGHLDSRLRGNGNRKGVRLWRTPPHFLISPPSFHFAPFDFHSAIPYPFLCVLRALCGEPFPATFPP